MSPAEEINQLDRSLSEMTSLLLSDGDDELDLDGDFATLSTEPASSARPKEASGIEPESSTDDSEDAGRQVEHVQAAVAAALEEVAGDLDPEPEPEPRAEADPRTHDLADGAEPIDESPGDAGRPDEDQIAAALDATAEDLDPIEEAPEPALGRDDEPDLHRPAQPETGPLKAPVSEPIAAPPAPITQPAAPSLSLRLRVAAAGAPLADLLDRALEPMAERLAGQTKVLRHSLAWLALWTAFNAGGVWAYLAFFRSSGAQVDPAAMTQISGAAAAQSGRPGETTERD